MHARGHVPGYVSGHVPGATGARSRTLSRCIACAGAALFLAACAGTSEHAPRDPQQAELQSCRQLFTLLDARVEQAQAADAQYARIAGFAYLRINRFLAADEFIPDPEDGDFDLWVEALRKLDVEARGIELQNLPRGAGDAAETADARRLNRCSSLLARADLSTPAARAELLEAAWVPDEYSITKRVIGLYPFTSLPFNAGVNNLHADMRETFSKPLEALAVEGRLTRYVPPSVTAHAGGASPRAVLARAARDRHGIAQLSRRERAQLLDAFAPVYEIDVLSDDDRIGAPYWAGDGLPAVDTRRPTVFRRMSHTRFEGRTLLQLNYSVWFPARPASGDFDLLSGRLDGITFRVTLDDDAQPLIYDSMHNCGCYHLFVPTERLRRKPPGAEHAELPLVAQRLALQKGRVVLRIAHGSHYLQRVYFDASPGGGEVYAMADDDALRSLPLANGERRSLFGPDGIVVGSERGERWFFWPMGIAEPGAMRQWGRHATAFVGKRHFDEAHLIERYFVSVQ